MLEVVHKAKCDFIWKIAENLVTFKTLTPLLWSELAPFTSVTISMEVIMETLNTLYKIDNIKMLYLLYNQINRFSKFTSLSVTNGIIYIFVSYLEISVILAQSTKSAPIQANGATIQNFNQTWKIFLFKY
jgi:hypothetical protein